ncbi:MAG: hypothetical protein ACREOV_08985 [Candidatus Dormibacteraceae bacterium]
MIRNRTGFMVRCGLVALAAILGYLMGHQTTGDGTVTGIALGTAVAIAAFSERGSDSGARGCSGRRRSALRP